MEKIKNKWYDFIKLPFICGGVYSYFQIIIFVIQRAIPLLNVYILASLIDNTIEVVNGKKEAAALLVPGIMFGIIVILKNAASVINGIVSEGVVSGIRKNYVTYIVKKCASLKYREIEDEETCDIIKRVKNDADMQMQKGYNAFLKLLGIVVEIICYIVILYRITSYVVLIVFVVSCILVFISVINGKKQYAFVQDTASDSRHIDYYDEIMTSRESAAERNLFRTGKYVQDKWVEYYKKIKKKEKSVTIKSLVQMKSVSSIMGLVTAGMALIMLNPLSNKLITLGLYISLVQMAMELVDLMSWDLTDYIIDFTKYVSYLKDFHKFVLLEEEEDALTEPKERGIDAEKIVFSDVSFRYPKAEKEVLRHINLVLEKGKHYAIVGENGSGKSTLIKVLLGLYDNYEGDILLNDKSLRTLSMAEKKAIFSTLFQDFAEYQISIKDNIGLGNINALGTKELDQKIEKAVSDFGLKKVIGQGKNGLDTELGKLDKEGMGVSGGEWQRIAMMRTVVSNASVLILDEPTAALDPVAESRLYEDFDKISRGRTTILITHRLASIKLADSIIVLNKGEIVGAGNHDELMEKCDIYRNMYEMQRSWYEE